MEKQNNDIEKLFKEKLENLEVDPSKNTWSNIKAGLGATTTGVIASQVTSSTSWTASIVAGTIITVTAIGGYFFFDNQGAQQKNNVQQIEQPVESPSSNNEAEQRQGANPFSEEIQEQNTTNSDLIGEDSKISPDNQTVTTENKIGSASSSSNTSNEEFYSSEKTIEELIADSQAQFEANLLEAIRLEEANRTTPTDQKTHGENQQETSSHEKNVERKSTETLDEEEEDITKTIEFPNAFTPNYDGINDVFSLGEQYHDKIDNIAVYIYSSSNTIIHEWKVLNGGWDGTLRDGSIAPEGVYSYNAILTKDKVNYRVKGIVNLKR